MSLFCAAAEDKRAVPTRVVLFLDRAARKQRRHLGEHCPAQETTRPLAPKRAVSLPRRRPSRRAARGSGLWAGSRSPREPFLPRPSPAGTEKAARGCGPKAGPLSAFGASGVLRGSLSPVVSEVPAQHHTSHTGTARLGLRGHPRLGPHLPQHPKCGARRLVGLGV